MGNAELYKTAQEANPLCHDRIGSKEAGAQSHGSELQERFKQTSTDHWHPDCLCAPLHGDCSAAEEPPLGPSTSSNSHYVIMKLEEIQRGAQMACWFCSVILTGIKNMPAWDPSKPAPKRIDFYIQRSESGIKIESMREFRRLVAEPSLLFYIDGEEETVSPCRRIQVRQEKVCSDPDDQVRFISKALQNCLQNHSCAPKPNQFMPTRLIHIRVIDGKHAAFLVQGVEPKPYVTLSHCWGPSFPPWAKTIESNLESRLSSDGIPWEELPQTFRDAIVTTTRLGFDYIWIDALCIIQDSPADWGAEAMLMSEVYSYGALMLSSDASPDTNTGFFRSASMTTLPWSVPDHGFSIKARFNLVHKTYGQMSDMYKPFDQSYIYPLSTRAWCYQEGRLARRIVHFSVDEVSYDCIDGVECHCGYYGPSGHKYGVNSWYKTLPDSACTMEEKHTLWRNTVTMYSERNLTFMADRFPAISALAKQFHRPVTNSVEAENSSIKTPSNFRDISLGDYVAGFWSKFLMGDLFWYADYSPGVRKSTASTYVAPTWSWASVSGSVNWGETGALDAVLVGAHHVLAGPDYFGQITYAEVVLEAKLVPVTLSWETAYYKQTKEVYMDLQCRDPSSGSQVCLGAYRPDYFVPEPDVKFYGGYIFSLEHPKEVPAERIPVTDGKYFALLFGETAVMIIKAIEGQGPGVYERAGTVHSHRTMHSGDMRKWFEGAERQVVKIL
ncbi:het-domain-containing protein [Fusarium flagelliforme]|uniref:Het-domain-containing protein n=1 Tax=Fusarium flagelliforme TaxID=2675880 RepID=A0A395MEL8_9HYPO|nr:het-domain-containing protein [Fusarium flagelliforme]